MNEGLEQAKRVARDELKATIAALRHDLDSISHAVCSHIQSQTWWAEAATVMVFAPMPGEIDLGSLAISAISGGKRVCVPRVDWASRSMSAVVVRRWPEDLVRGRHSVPEPGAGLALAEASDLDVILAPGLGFDARGNRLGRGAGFYDRFLRSPGLRAVVAGVCPEAAIRDVIPAGATDVPVRLLVTERRVLFCGGS